MDQLHMNEMKIDLRQVDGAWHVVLERSGERREMDGMTELIRYLQSLAATDRPPRGLR
jgi:hypothetical protein